MCLAVPLVIVAVFDHKPCKLIQPLALLGEALLLEHLHNDPKH